MVNGGPTNEGARDPENGAIGHVSFEVEEIYVQMKTNRRKRRIEMTLREMM
jgi:hypothetical protein